MGGAGSGRLNATDALIRQTTKQPQAESRTPIATEMFIPNLSGDHSHGNVQRTPTANTDIANKKYVDDAIAAVPVVTNHALLSNLDYASAAHTGFLPAANPIFTGAMTGGSYSGSSLWLNGHANITGNVSGTNILATGTLSGANVFASTAIGLGTNSPQATMHVVKPGQIPIAPAGGASACLFQTNAQYAAEFMTTATDFSGFLLRNTTATGVPFVQLYNSNSANIWTITMNTDDTFNIRHGVGADPAQFTIANTGLITFSGTINGTNATFSSNAAAEYVTIKNAARTIRLGVDGSIGASFCSTVYAGFCMPDANDILPLYGGALTNGTTHLGRAGITFGNFIGTGVIINNASVTASISGATIYSSGKITAAGTLSGSGIWSSQYINAAGNISGSALFVTNSAIANNFVVNLTAGEDISGGKIVCAARDADLKVKLCGLTDGTASRDQPLGIAQATTLSGSAIAVIISGIADIYNSGEGNVTRGDFIQPSDTYNGEAIATAVPPVPSDANHWREVGHAIQSKTGAGLFKAIIHFN